MRLGPMSWRRLRSEHSSSEQCRLWFAFQVRCVFHCFGSSSGKLLDLHQACRLGFLKIDAEGMDELLLRAYVKYLWEHPPCWADGIEFEVNHFLKSSKTIDVWTALERLGYRMISALTWYFASCRYARRFY